MSSKKNESKTMSFAVTENLSVGVLPHTQHEFLMSTENVSMGYGINPNSLRSHASRNKDELIKGKHFIKAVEIFNDLPHGVQPQATFWTKRGVVRLGFFIKSERAKMFRNWAEDLVINVTGHKLPALPETPKKRHNRLTTQRLLNIMVDVAKIDDREVRLSITNKLMEGEA
jgi:hypothetical protein